MNEKVLKTLEYNKILNQLSEYACSPEAKKRCLALRPITDKAQIEQLQLQTKHWLLMVRSVPVSLHMRSSRS